MSDVPYYAFAVCSTWFFLRGLRTDSVVDSVVGTALASIAVLDRQLGLAMPLAFGLALLSTKRLGLRNVGIAFTPTAFVLGMQFLYQKALQFSGRLPALYNQQALLLSETWSREAEQTMRIVVKNASFGLVYVGLFVFPFLLAVCPLESRHRSRRNGALNRAALSLLSVLAIAVFFSKRRQMPLFGNVLHETGIGPLSVLWGWASLPVPPTTTALVDAFWKLATIVGVIGAVSLLYRFSVGVTRLVGSARVKSEKVKRTDAFVLSLLLINFAPITLLERGVYDRYVLPMLPLSLMLVGISCARIDDQRVSRSMVIAFVVTILMGGFTVAATHDYLSWNRVRWLASRELTEDSSISLEDLNGGFEFRGWHFGYRLESCNPSYEGVSSRPRVSWDDFTCLEGPDDHYTYGLSFAARDGYEVMRRYPVDAWLPFSPDRILVLRKEL